MAGSGKKWFIGCGVGCAAVVLLGILGVIGSVVVLTRPFDRAVGVQQELTELYGDRDDYVPPAKGIAPQRLQAFIAVRKSILDHCEEFEDVQEAFLEMEELDQEGDPPPARAVIRGVGRVMGVAFGLVGKIGGLVEDRNEALLEHDMGLGEYTWIYVLAYNSYLGMRPNTGIDDEEGHCYAGSEWRTLQRLIENHIEIERKTVDFATESLEALKGTKMVVIQYLLEYLLTDENKHNELLDNLEGIKKAMYPYG